MRRREEGNREENKRGRERGKVGGAESAEKNRCH